MIYYHLLYIFRQRFLSLSLDLNQAVDLWFLIDASKYVSNSNLERMKDFVILQGRIYNISTNVVRVALLSYDSGSRQILPSEKGTSLAALKASVDKLTKTNRPRLVENALKFVKERLIRNRDKQNSRKNAGKVVVVVMAGKNEQEKFDELRREAQDLRHTGADIAVVAIGSDVLEEEIKSVATRPSRIALIPSWYRISEATPVVSDLVRSAQKITAKLDLGFIIGVDNPNSAADFNLGKEFIASVLRKLTISPDQTRFGLIVYGANAGMVMKLDTFSDNAKAIRIIEMLNTPRPGDALARAVDIGRSDLFNAKYGERKDAPNTAMVFVNKEIDAASKVAIERMKKDGVKVVLVVLGKVLDVKSLKDVASKGDNVLKVGSKDELRRAVDGAMSTILPGNYDI